MNSSDPVIALVGRPNVGKSTLFNRLTRSRDALASNFSGLTRDRHYGIGRISQQPFIVIDTGGFEPIAKNGIFALMAQQTRQAIAEADIVMFIVDGRLGLAPQDHLIANELRKTGAVHGKNSPVTSKIFLVINKAEGMKYGIVTAEFYELGLSQIHVISAAHGDGVLELIEVALHTRQCGTADNTDIAVSQNHSTKIAIVGRPNVGKSTLINALLGEERVVAFDMPGTTRDAIYIPFEYQHRFYTLIDTAGLRKRGKIFEAVEKFSVVKTVQAITEANVVVLVLDAQENICEQDAHIAGFILESGRALVVVINKWDGLEQYQRERIKTEMSRKLRFLDFANLHYISAAHGVGLAQVMNSVHDAYLAATIKLSTPKLTRILAQAVEFQQPQRSGIFRPKLRYAHQGGMNPPLVIVHGNALSSLTASYKRYLENKFIAAFSLKGTPLKVEFRSSKNPYAVVNT